MNRAYILKALLDALKPGDWAGEPRRRQGKALREKSGKGAFTPALQEIGCPKTEQRCPGGPTAPLCEVEAGRRCETQRTRYETTYNSIAIAALFT